MALACTGLGAYLGRKSLNIVSKLILGRLSAIGGLGNKNNSSNNSNRVTDVNIDVNLLEEEDNINSNSKKTTKDNNDEVSQ